MLTAQPNAHITSTNSIGSHRIKPVLVTKLITTTTTATTVQRCSRSSKCKSGRIACTPPHTLNKFSEINKLMAKTLQTLPYVHTMANTLAFSYRYVFIYKPCQKFGSTENAVQMNCIQSNAHEARRSHLTSYVIDTHRNQLNPLGSFICADGTARANTLSVYIYECDDHICYINRKQ